METLLNPIGNDDGVKCWTCLKLVDVESIVENRLGVPKNIVTLLCKCHGAEERVELDLGTETWDDRDLARAVKGVRMFDPTTEAP